VQGDLEHIKALNSSAKRQLLEMFAPKGLDFGYLKGTAICPTIPALLSIN